MNKYDLIKNVDRIDSICKSNYHPPVSAEELKQGTERSIPVIKIRYIEEVDGNLGIEIPFDSVESRDKAYEEMSNSLDARLFDGK